MDVFYCSFFYFMFFFVNTVQYISKGLLRNQTQSTAYCMLVNLVNKNNYLEKSFNLLNSFLIFQNQTISNLRRAMALCNNVHNFITA